MAITTMLPGIKTLAADSAMQTVNIPVVADFSAEGSISVKLNQSTAVTSSNVTFSLTTDSLAYQSTFLTSPERTALQEEGKNYDVVINVDQGKYSDVKTVIEHTIGDASSKNKVIYDITVSVNNENRTELPSSVSFTFTAPSDLDTLKASDMKFVRVHQESTDSYNVLVIPATYDAAARTVSFETSVFSDFVLLYDSETQASDENDTVVLTLYDDDDKETKLSGGKFALYNDDTDRKTGTYRTDSSGRIKIEDLDAGDYYFVQEKAPSGYDIYEKNISFSITDSGKTVKLSVYNKKTSDEENDDESITGYNTSGTDSSSSAGQTTDQTAQSDAGTSDISNILTAARQYATGDDGDILKHLFIFIAAVIMLIAVLL